MIRSLRSYLTQFQNPDYIQINSRDKLRFQYLLALGLLLIVSAICALSLNSTLFVSFNYMIKIPIFSCLGIAITFALGVCIVDVINLTFRLVQSKDERPPINSSRQVIFIFKTVNRYYQLYLYAALWECSLEQFLG